MSKSYSPTDKFLRYREGDIKGFRYYLIFAYHLLYPYSYSITRNENMAMKIIFKAFQSCWLDRWNMLTHEHLIGTVSDIVKSDSYSFRRAAMNSSGDMGSGSAAASREAFDIAKLYDEMRLDIYRKMDKRSRRHLQVFHDLSKKAFMEGKENVQLSRTIKAIFDMMSQEKI